MKAISWTVIMIIVMVAFNLNTFTKYGIHKVTKLGYDSSNDYTFVAVMMC